MKRGTRVKTSGDPVEAPSDLGLHLTVRLPDSLPGDTYPHHFRKELYFYRKAYLKDGHFPGLPRPHSSLSSGNLVLGTKEVTGPALGSAADMSGRATALLGDPPAYHPG